MLTDSEAVGVAIYTAGVILACAVFALAAYKFFRLVLAPLDTYTFSSTHGAASNETDTHDAPPLDRRQYLADKYHYGPGLTEEEMEEWQDLERAKLRALAGRNGKGGA